MNQPTWRTTALALATATLLGLWASDAAALALGRVNVQSALGEPLRADIEIVEINADEAASLRTRLASPEAFRAAGLEYNPALSGIEITLQRRPDGRYFLLLSSQRPINDPFVDLILETQWASGRIVRDYTLLFDPASLRQNAPAPAAAQVAPVAPPGRAAPAAASAPVPKEPASAALSAKEPAARADGKQVKVQSGDTAGKIALANKPVNVSLDQMLVALLQANPDAFVSGNVNRLKAGAVLEIPSADQASQESAEAASKTVIAQSRDFNEFRRRLAEGLATAKVAPAEQRKAAGKVQAQVQEKKPAAPSTDKLTLSKGAVQGKAVEDKIAREREAKDAATRLAELNKNISDLNKLGTAAPAMAPAASGNKPAGTVAAPPVAASATRPAASMAMPTVPVPAVLPATTSPMAPVPAPVASAAVVAAAATAASAPASAVAAVTIPAPAATASATAASAPEAAAKPAPAPAAAPKVARKPIPAPVEETSLIDDLLDNPLVLGGVALVVAILGGFGFYKLRQRKKATQVDSSFLESRLQPDSFFGASGGQRVDTNEGGATGSSMVYSPSQLDAAGDVDPVAEADVYLAYGRDLQAEEILKEAMRTTPQRVAIHSKLLEIYSKRRDTKAFELVATEAYNLTHGEGPEWEHICELGQELDAGNKLYRPGGQPAQAQAQAEVAAATFAPTATTRVEAAAEAPSAPVDLDLDLDFSLGDDAPEPPVAAAEPKPKASAVAQTPKSLDMDFSATAAQAAAVASAPISLDLGAVEKTGKLEPVSAALPDLELSDEGLTFTTEPVAAPTASAAEAAAPAPAAATDGGMIEFDLGSLSLDLPNTAQPAAAPATAPAASVPVSAGDAGSTGGFEDASNGGSDPLATKFALAQEFNAIGDPDGARSLAEEVLAEASGELKHRAQRFLAEIG
jgi:pilus assembly protein FimV